MKALPKPLLLMALKLCIEPFMYCNLTASIRLVLDSLIFRTSKGTHLDRMGLNL
jgi:hypothetical protein